MRAGSSLVRRTSLLVALATVVAAGLISVHLLDPEWSPTVRGATLIAAVLAAWAGVIWIPAYRWTSGCVAMGSTLVALGDVTSGVLDGLGVTVAGLGMSDLAFLLAYLVLWLGLRRLLPRGGRRTRAARLDGLIDATAVFVVMAYVEWELAVATCRTPGRLPVESRRSGCCTRSSTPSSSPSPSVCGPPGAPATGGSSSSPQDWRAGSPPISVICWAGDAGVVGSTWLLAPRLLRGGDLVTPAAARRAGRRRRPAAHGGPDRPGPGAGAGPRRGRGRRAMAPGRTASRCPA